MIPDRIPATKHIGRIERKKNRKDNKEQEIKRLNLAKEQEYRELKLLQAQQSYYIQNLKAVIKYYNDITKLFVIKDYNEKPFTTETPEEQLLICYNFARITSGMNGLYFNNDDFDNYSITLHLTIELLESRKNVYATLTGKHKIGINKEIRTKMLANTMDIPYELADIVNKYI